MKVLCGMLHVVAGSRPIFPIEVLSDQEVVLQAVTGDVWDGLYLQKPIDEGDKHFSRNF